MHPPARGNNGRRTMSVPRRSCEARSASFSACHLRGRCGPTPRHSVAGWRLSSSRLGSARSAVGPRSRFGARSVERPRGCLDWPGRARCSGCLAAQPLQRPRPPLPAGADGGGGGRPHAGDAGGPDHCRSGPGARHALAHCRGRARPLRGAGARRGSGGGPADSARGAALGGRLRRPGSGDPRGGAWAMVPRGGRGGLRAGRAAGPLGGASRRAAALPRGRRCGGAVEPAAHRGVQQLPDPHPLRRRPRGAALPHCAPEPQLPAERAPGPGAARSRGSPRAEAHRRGRGADDLLRG
mmetsp:Transcript_34280/g.107060  ORF Transcript_34280/g.107060 Transcript_34280/m.107060 type:complete len:296 (-) Transcript_34280:145-1032(-)